MTTVAKKIDSARVDYEHNHARPKTPLSTYLLIGIIGAIATSIFLFLATSIAPDPVMMHASFTLSFISATSTLLTFFYLYHRAKREDPLALTAFLGVFILGTASSLFAQVYFHTGILPTIGFGTVGFLGALNAGRMVCMEDREIKAHFQDHLNVLFSSQNGPNNDLLCKLIAIEGPYPEIMEEKFRVGRYYKTPLDLALSLDNPLAFIYLMELNSSSLKEEHLEVMMDKVTKLNYNPLWLQAIATFRYKTLGEETLCKQLAIESREPKLDQAIYQETISLYPSLKQN